MYFIILFILSFIPHGLWGPHTSNTIEPNEQNNSEKDCITKKNEHLNVKCLVIMIHVFLTFMIHVT